MPKLKQVDFIKTDITEKVHVNKYQKLNQNQSDSFARITAIPENADSAFKMKANFGGYAVMEFENGNEYRVHTDGRIYNLKTGRKEAKADKTEKHLNDNQEQAVATIMRLPENAHQDYKILEIVSSGQFGYAVLKTEEGEEWMIDNDGKYSRMTMDFDDDWKQRRYAYESELDFGNVDIMHFAVRDADSANAWCKQQWKNNLIVYRRDDDIDGGWEFIAVPTELSAKELEKFFGADFEICNELLNEVSPSFYDEAKGLSKKEIDYINKARKLVKSKKAKSVEDIEDELGYGIVDKAVLRDTFFKEARTPIDVDNGKDEAMAQFVQELSEETYGGNALKTLDRKTILKLALENFPGWDDKSDVQYYLDRAIQDFADSHPNFFDEEVVTATNFGRVNVEAGAMDRRENKSKPTLAQIKQLFDAMEDYEAEQDEPNFDRFKLEVMTDEVVESMSKAGFSEGEIEDVMSGNKTIDEIYNSKGIKTESKTMKLDQIQDYEEFAETLEAMHSSSYTPWIQVGDYRFSVGKTFFIEKMVNGVPKTIHEEEYFKPEDLVETLTKVLDQMKAGTYKEAKYQKENEWKQIYDGISEAYAKYGNPTDEQLASTVINLKNIPNPVEFFQNSETCQDVLKQWKVDHNR